MKTSTMLIQVQGCTLQVTFTYSPPCRGTRDRYGAPETPDDPEEFEIEQVRCGGEDITDLLEEGALDRIEEALKKPRMATWKT